MRYFILPLFVLVISSCLEEKSLSDQFGFELLMALDQNDTNRIKGLYLTLDDSLVVSDSGALHWINFWKEYPTSYEQYLNSTQGHQVLWWREKFEDLELQSPVEFLRTELDTSYFTITPIGGGESMRGRDIPIMQVFFKVNSNEYYFWVDPVYHTDVGFKMKGFDTPTSEAIEQEIEENTPFTPPGLQFINYNWSMERDCKTFDSFFVTLSNKTPHDFEYIKYKATISELYGEAIFSKTIEIHDKVFSGDIMKYQVKELNNYFAGFNICDQNSFQCRLDVLDARPKPKK